MGSGEGGVNDRNWVRSDLSPVLGLIYSGYSNEQIAGELAVAATTIKTHIRNLYQKLGVAHRQDAVQHAQQLLKMMEYGV
nr:LuxR C-terminal-related transcriptional regulator [Salmonella enterica]